MHAFKHNKFKNKPSKHTKKIFFGERIINEGYYGRDTKKHILKNHLHIYSDHQRLNYNLDL